MRVSLRPCTHVCDVCLRACVIFLFSLEKYVNVFICLGLCVRVCLCFESSNVSEILQPCFIQ